MPTDLTPIIQQELDAEGVPHFDLASKIAVAISLAIQGWRPPAQVIETSEELDALPDLSIVVIPNGLAVQKWHGDGQTVWIGASDPLVRVSSHRLISIWREVSLLHVPTENAGH